MFPSVRLMIVATFASVVALMCGFGMFAAFRVSHEPFARLPPTSAPLQLVVADNTNVSPLAFASSEPFERRFQFGELPNFPPVADIPTRERDRHGAGETTPAAAGVAPEIGVAEVRAAIVGGPIVQIASSGPRPGEEPALQTVGSSEDHQAPEASAQAASPSAVNGGVPAAPTPPDATTAEVAGEPPPPTASAPVGEAAATPVLVALVPPADQAPLPEVAKPPSEIAPTGAATATAHKKAAKSAKKTKHVRVGARIRRIHRTPAAALAEASQGINQNSTFPQSNFQTAPQTTQLQWTQDRPARSRRARVASGGTARPSSATGGPFVGVPKK
jgi:hypothetical protein